MPLTAEGLTVRRRGDAGEHVVVDAAAFTLPSGSVTDLGGPSGSGKTSLLLALARLVPGAQGRLVLDGRPASEVPPQEWRASVALVPQKASLVPGTVAGNLLLPWTLKVRAHTPRPPDADLRDALDAVGMGDVALERDTARLSVGQAARVALLRVVLARPEVLLLDEPDAALDDAAAALVADLTRSFCAAGGSVLRVRHRGDDGLAARRWRLEGGRLAGEGVR